MTDEKPYVDAAKAAALLGCDREAVVADVRRGMAGALDTLSGGFAGTICVVDRWELEGERLAMHRARLAVPKSEVPE